MVLSKPVSYFSFTTTKLIASSLTFVISLSITSLFTFGYTVWLIEGTSFGPFVLTNLLTALFLIFCLAVTILFSSLFKSSLAAGGISIGFIIAFSALSAIPVLGKYTPGKLLTWGIDLMAGRGEPYWWSLAISLTIIALCLYLAPKFLKHKEM